MMFKVRCIPSPASMLRMVLFVSLVALCAAGGGMKKYAHMKILEQCMGEDYVQGYYTQMKASSKKCSTMPQLMSVEELDFQDVIDEIRNMALPWGSRQETANKYFKLLPSRGKRAANSEPHKHTTTEKLYYMKEKMACMIGNMTCMLRDLDWMKEDKTPNYALYEKDINNNPAASEDLKVFRSSGIIIDILFIEGIVGGLVFLHPVKITEHAGHVSNHASHLLLHVVELLSGGVFVRL